MSIEKRLAQRKAVGNLRSLRTHASLIDFSSNDYLGLARSSQLAAAAIEECQKHSLHLNGVGSTGSRLLTGNSHYAEALEERIAQFHGYPAGILFNCGYMANVGLLSAIAGSEDVIFFDTKIHASTYDGMRLSRAQTYPFRHNDLGHLENRLKKCSSHGDRFICIESIYSTDGSQAPLVEITQLTQQYGAHLIVDEAHAVGIRGPQGRGLVAEYNLTEHVFAQVVTFGKAPGTHGAIVLGSELLKEALINFATSYIYTTALPLHALAAIKCSYDLFPGMEEERQHLRHLIDISQKAFPSPSPTHIQSIPVAGNAAAKKLAEEIRNQGFDVRPLLSPTVQRGDERLRICLHAFNRVDDLVRLFFH